jgi:hypothetical protein
MTMDLTFIDNVSVVKRHQDLFQEPSQFIQTQAALRSFWAERQLGIRTIELSARRAKKIVGENRRLGLDASES